MHWSRGSSCTNHVTVNALITWLIMQWSRGYNALITWLIIHCSRACHAQITWLTMNWSRGYNSLITWISRWVQSETGRTGIWSPVCLHYYWVNLLEVCTIAWNAVFLALTWFSTALGSHFPIHLGLHFPFVRNSPHFPPPAPAAPPPHFFLWTELKEQALL